MFNHMLSYTGLKLRGAVCSLRCGEKWQEYNTFVKTQKDPVFGIFYTDRLYCGVNIVKNVISLSITLLQLSVSCQFTLRTFTNMSSQMRMRTNPKMFWLLSHQKSLKYELFTGYVQETQNTLFVSYLFVLFIYPYCY